MKSNPRKARQVTPGTISDSMGSCCNHALISAREYGHDFGGSLTHPSTKLTNQEPTPKLSQVGQYYLDCIKCGRTVFEDGTGSATQSGCKV